MARLTSVRTDTKKCNEGIWQHFDNGIEFLIGKKPNTAYSEKLALLSKPYKELIRRQQLPREQDEALTLQAVCGTVVLDWKNIEDDKGVTIPFSEEKALEILSDPLYADVYNWILLISHSSALFRMEEEVDEAKNSVITSPGS